MREPDRSPRDLEERNHAFDLAMEIFQLTKGFPQEETYSLTDQIRRSSRSVTSNVAEAWYRRRYEASFVAKLVDSCAEAGETRDWFDYALACKYIDEEIYSRLDPGNESVLRTLNGMITYSGKGFHSAMPQTTSDRPQTT